MSLKLRSGKKGIEIRLHDLEAAVMDVIWGRRLTSFSVNDVLVVLEKKRDIAYTTVMTTVSRLFEKGLLDRTKDGKRYLYSPRLSREEFLESTAREVLETAVDRPRAMAMLAANLSEASSTELDELEALIRQRREELDE